MDKKQNSKSRFLWYAIALGLITLFLLMLLSSVLAVGERLNRINKWVEYGFYALVVFLVYFLILRPVHIILFSPSFSVETTLDKETRKNLKVYKSVTKKFNWTKYFTWRNEQRINGTLQKIQKN